ncbi:MAG: DUF2809 domain-containing protein [Bacteroidota bacterium]
MNRSRLIYSFLFIVVIGLGLLSRSWDGVPKVIYPYQGDYLYAIMWCLMITIVFPAMRSWKVGIISLLICYGIECSQLIQADWMNQIRSYRIGGLILGFGFLWSDMISYSLGIFTAYGLEKIVPQNIQIDNRLY